MRQKVVGVVVAILAVVLTGFAVVNASASGGGSTPRMKLTIVAPAAPGGGWDTFAREAQQIMRVEGITNAVQVTNVPGAGGTIGLAQVAQMGDRHDVMMVTGGVMIGGIVINNSAVTLNEVTPIARLADDYNVLVVPGDSPYQTLDDFMVAFTANPSGTAIGGGSLGGIDHLLAGMIAQDAGVDPAKINYLAYSGGGEVVTSLLSHTTVAGLSSYNDFRDQIESGNLRALAVSSTERIPGVDVPTFQEQGVDVAMANWRGYVAPPGITPHVRAELIAMVTELHATEQWGAVMERNRWTDSFMTGDEFADFIREESARTTELIKELGL